jgi:hypothetical protein
LLKLIKSFDFKFGFCIPGSTNTWDAVYDVPPLDEDLGELSYDFETPVPYLILLYLVNEIIDNPYETKSDSFYFVNDKLIMHNKASYRVKAGI